MTEVNMKYAPNSKLSLQSLSIAMGTYFVLWLTMIISLLMAMFQGGSWQAIRTFFDSILSQPLEASSSVRPCENLLNMYVYMNDLQHCQGRASLFSYRSEMYSKNWVHQRLTMFDVGTSHDRLPLKVNNEIFCITQKHGRSRYGLSRGQ